MTSTHHHSQTAMINGYIEQRGYHGL